MTVAELIEELKLMPQHQPVCVVPENVIEGDGYMNLCDEDATEAVEVRRMGAWVLVKGRSA